ncbi:MAG: GatB/YqeY domain-containing protein [Bacteroidales bacterium]|jgi:uncharacterized protein YqeY|nr:GatB/YqeY domain-containing protein [Bacteroidales bacterium]MCI2121661.1 GatB/YqeY domain-containing protein [Bacteroidales bacterium]MCI2144975.1 GatB/YqeY domain-containing protein [Bacteroidales bacterium]
MTLEEQIQQDLKAAMRAHDSASLDAIRGVKSEILLAKSSAGDSSHTVSDVDIIKIVQKMVKQRKESADIYVRQNRRDLADVELAQISVLEKYLPRQMSAEEIENAVSQVIAETGASSMADLGKVMGAATKKLAGSADGKAISQAARKLLS